MRRVALLLGAVLIGFMVSSCGEPTQEKIYKEVDMMFTQKEAEVKAIDNADDLLAFVNAMNETPELEILRKYANDNDELEDLTAEEADKLFDRMLERRSVYEAVQEEKCTEILEPLIADYEKVVADLYEDYENDVPEPDEAMIDQWSKLYDQVYQYADIIPDALADRFLEADDLIDFMFGLGDYAEDEE